MAQLKKSLITLSSGLVLLLFATNSFAKLDGITGYSGNPADITGGQTCTACHALGTGIVPPAVEVLGSRTVKAGSANSYKIVMTRQDNAVAEKNRIGGFSVSADLGTLLIKNRIYTQPSSNEIIHKLAIGSTTATASGSRKVMVDGKTITWLFEWNAPDPAPAQPATLYISALSGNNDSNTSNDSSRSIKVPINVVQTLTAVDDVVKAIIRAPFTIPTNTPVVFSASDSTVTTGSGFIEKYEWVFSDKPTEILTSEFVRRSFSAATTITATLKATTNTNVTSSTYFDIQVLDKVSIPDAEVPLASISAPVEGNVNTDITFDASGSSPQPMKQYIWDFGDPNDPVIVKSLQPEIPTITHKFTAIGTYTVTLAAQSANGFTNIDVFNIKIVDGTAVTPPVNVITGEQLYSGIVDVVNNPNSLETSCSGGTCHGVAGLANGTVKKIKGTTKQLIDDSIAGVNGVTATMMTRIQNATTLDINSSQLIADYLGQVNPAVSLLDGSELYKTRCELCHGVNADGIQPAGVPIRGLDIRGATQVKIRNAINQVVQNGKVAIPLMKGIKLSDIEASYLVKFLALPAGTVANAITGKALFITNCETCHGTGSGGLAISLINPVTNITAIDRGIINVPMMQNINLNAQAKLDIIAYLSAPLPLPPVTGKGIYDMYCSYCHGLDGKGGMVSEKSIAGKKFKASNVIDAYTNKIDAMRNSNLKNVGFTDGGAILDLNLVVKHIEQLKGSN